MQVPGSVLSINTGDASPSYIWQYPIPQAITSKVKARVQTWYENGWVKDAPARFRWNSPILAAPKPAKERGYPDDIRVCLNGRFINDKMVDIPDSNLPLLRCY